MNNAPDKQEEGKRRVLDALIVSFVMGYQNVHDWSGNVMFTYPQEMSEKYSPCTGLS